MRITKKRVGILLILMVLGLLTGIAIYQNNGPKRTQSYFQFVEAGVETGSIEDNGTLWLVTVMSVSFKAVGGDAHDVYVLSWAGAEPYEVGTMLNNKTATVLLFSPRGAAIRMQNGEFRTKIRIASNEAAEDLVVVLSP